MTNPPDDDRPAPLVSGLYEQVIDRLLQRRMEGLADRGLEAAVEPIDPGDSDAALGDHLREVIRGALESADGEGRVALVDRLVAILEAADRVVAPPARRLLAVHPRGGGGADRPDIPLSTGGLLAGTRLDPSLASQLRKELASADRVDILCSFIKWAGVRILEADLRAFVDRPDARLRVLTTSYMGATDLKAVEFLRSLPRTEVRVSYDTERTRLHAKAYLFRRATAFGSAYIGSANLSRPALTEGLEWTVKVSQRESAHLWDRVAATFETYWEDGEFEPYTEAQRPRLKMALEQEQGRGADGPGLSPYTLSPHPFQREILDRIDAERRVQGLDRHLVVAATGTGKTMIAAFDYRRWSLDRADEAGRRPRLLFIAHREELLAQALRAFRDVLRDPNFGDLLVGGREPDQDRHLFASIQSYNSRSLHALPAGHFDYVVVDEFHHAAASSYRRLLDHVRPRSLLGLTATPERADGLDILGHFGGRMSAQIRLPDAINRKLLSPFQYFAVTDLVDLEGLAWRRGGYQIGDLDRVYTGNDARAGLVVDKVRSILLDPSKARGLGFCVSVRHAEFMADRFNRAGISAEALSSSTPEADRRSAQDRLRRREVNFLFVVDLYNEGVDIPEVDAVLFLRPTESLTVFLQQLGRGLRLHEQKECLTVLDFVGRAHRDFRFDLRYRALLTDPSVSLEEQVEHGFSRLPAGCSVVLERVARQYILENIQQALRQTRSSLVRELAEMARDLGRTPGFGEFLRRAGIGLDDLYRRKIGWSRLGVEAGLREPFADPDEAALTKGLRRLAHISDPSQIGFVRDWLGPGPGPVAIEAGSVEDRRLLMLDLCLWGRGHLPDSPDESLRRLSTNPILREELRELLDDRLAGVDSVAPRLELPFPCPLTLHANYTRDEVLAALGHWSRARQAEMREGVLHLREIKADAFFFTLNKAEKHYSPTTMYRDHAVSDRLFHWQSQSTTSADSETGRRYIEHARIGHVILLFGREHREVNQLAQPYAFLGPATYAGHEGSKPMSLTWRLEHPLPSRLYRTLARLAVA